jgi:hypothetical protein
MTRRNHAYQIAAGLALSGLIVALLPWSGGNVVAAIWAAARTKNAAKHSIAHVQSHLLAREAGNVDSVIRAGTRIILQGWAADLATLKPARSVQIFVNDENVAGVVPRYDRGDVAAALGRRLPQSLGFKADISANPSDIVTVFAELNDGTFAKLHYPSINP